MATTANSRTTALKDALALCWSATRVALGCHCTLPAGPARSAVGSGLVTYPRNHLVKMVVIGK